MKPFKKLLPVLAFILMSAALPNQENYILANDYTVTIHGTSNLHEWDETVTKVSGSGNVSLNDDGSSDLNALHMQMDVYSIKSSETVMNNKTYSALKASTNPEITFTLLTPIKSIKVTPNEVTYGVKGNLTIAGITNKVSMVVKAFMPSAGKLVFQGSQVVKMSDYGVAAPTALMGLLKTGDEITLSFKANFAIQNNL